MTDYNLGTARGVIQIDYRGTGPKQANADIAATGAAASKSSALLAGYKRQLITMAGFTSIAAIAGGFILATKTIAGFEKQLSAVEAVSGATGEQMDQVREKALQLGADTAYTASEATEAMEELVKAGISVEDVLNGAADAAVNLAAAGGVGIPEAATLAANAMNQFGLQASDLTGVVDTIAGAANASAIDVGQLGQSMKQVGAVAHLAGANFEDTATAIALLGNAGIVGSDAGTSLKTMFQNLQPTTLKQIDLFKELGLITEDGSNKFFDAQGNVKSYAQVAGVLSKALEGQSNQQKLLNLETLFGTDAIRAAAITAEAGARGVRELNSEMNETTAAEVAAKRMDNLSGSLDQLGGSIETALIRGGSGGLVALRALVDGLTDVINTGTELGGELSEELAPGFSDLWEAIQNVVAVGVVAADMFDDIVIAGGKLAGGAIIYTFNLLASILENVTGLLEGNEEAVVAAAIAYLILANGGVAVLTARLGTLAAYGIIRALDGLMALQAGAARTMASMRALAATVAAATATFAAVLILIAAVSAWQAYRQAVEETEEALKSASEARESGDLTTMRDEIAELRKLTAERKRLIKEAQDSQEGAGGFGFLNPLKWDDYLQAGEYEDAMGEINEASYETQKAMEDTASSILEIATATGTIDPQAAKELMDAFESGSPGALEDIEELIPRLEPLLDQAGIRVEQFMAALGGGGDISLETIRSKLAEVGATAGTTEAATESLSEAAAQFGDEALSAAEKADALKESLDSLIGVELDADQAAIQWREGLRKLREQLDSTSGALFGQGEAVDANRSAVIASTEDILERITAEAKAGASMTELTAMFKNSRQAMIDQAEAAHGNGEEMARLLDTYNFTPEAVKTLIEAVNVEKAQTAVEELIEKYKLTPEEVQTIFNASSADTASEKIKALRDYIKGLKGKDVDITVPGATDSTTDIKVLQAEIEKLKPKAAKMSTPGAVEAAAQIAALRDRINELRSRDIFINTYMKTIKSGSPDPAPGTTEDLFGGGTSPRTSSRPPRDPKLLGDLRRLQGAQRVDVPLVLGRSSRGVAGGSGGGESGRSRIVSGKLMIDPSGRAWIEGIAEDVYEEQEQFHTNRRGGGVRD